MPAKQRRRRVVVLRHRHVVHVFDPAGDLNILAAGRYAHRTVVDRLQARRTVAIDRHAGRFNRQPRDQTGNPGHVETLLALLLHAAPANIFNQRLLDSRPLNQSADQRRRKIVGSNITEVSGFRVSPGNGRADGIDDNSVTHRGSPNRGITSVVCGSTSADPIAADVLRPPWIVNSVEFTGLPAIDAACSVEDN